MSVRKVSIATLLRMLREQGFEVTTTSRGHHRISPPNTEHGIVHISNDSDDPRAFLNKLSQLKKSGFIPPWEEA